jgi:hypothetical protein
MGRVFGLLLAIAIAAAAIVGGSGGGSSTSTTVPTVGYTPIVSDGPRLIVTRYYTFVARRPEGNPARRSPRGSRPAHPADL